MFALEKQQAPIRRELEKQNDNFRKDPFKQEVVQNGANLLELIIELIMEDKDINYLQPLCEKIAIERAGADANIGDFVYNANVGRNELFEAMCELM